MSYPYSHGSLCSRVLSSTGLYCFRLHTFASTPSSSMYLSLPSHWRDHGKLNLKPSRKLTSKWLLSTYPVSQMLPCGSLFSSHTSVHLLTHVRNQIPHQPDSVHTFPQAVPRMHLSTCVFSIAFSHLTSSEALNLLPPRPCSTETSELSYLMALPTSLPGWAGGLCPPSASSMSLPLLLSLSALGPAAPFLRTPFASLFLHC